MINIPPEVQIRSTLRPGSVFCYEEETHSNPKYRYFVVLNPEPATADELVLLTATKEVEKARRRTALNPSMLILVTPSDYPEFTEEESAFNCDEAYVKSVAQLVVKLEEGALSLHSYMPAAIVERLRAGVKNSSVVAERTRELLDV